MRPAGEIRRALLQACVALATPERGATLQELAAHACVGLDAARRTVANMTRSKQLCMARQRRVAYRNRPVAEYVPAGRVPVVPAGAGVLVHVLTSWVG